MPNRPYPPSCKQPEEFFFGFVVVIARFGILFRHNRLDMVNKATAAAGGGGIGGGAREHIQMQSAAPLYITHGRSSS